MRSRAAKHRFWAGLCGVVCMALGISCTSDNLQDLNANKTCFSDTLKISFSSDVQPIFTTYCTDPGCHSGSAPQSNFNLEASVAYAQLSKKGSGYIDTLNPSASVVVAYMSSSATPMPPSGKLDRCKIELIKQWMAQGGKNN